MDEQLTFTGSGRPSSGRWLGWIAAIAVTFCLVSIMVLTIMLPDADQFGTKGGYIPISSTVR